MRPAPGGAGPDELLEMATGGSSGDRRSLARLLSIAEQGGAAGRHLARLTYARAGSSTGSPEAGSVRVSSAGAASAGASSPGVSSVGAYSVGLTGAPGAGKSTLTSGLIAEARRETSAPVAVLAIDPTSPLSGGAILGDRVRMQDHALDRGVFIRSMATRGHHGGLAAAVPDAIRLLDATGWPLVFVETVGVGQVEVEVAASCDTVIVVLNPGWGDAVQANKAGLLEVADILVINKADRPGVRETKRDLVHMLQLSHQLAWVPPIVETVASTGSGIGELWAAISTHRAHLEAAGGLEERRRRRLLDETERLATSTLSERVAAELRGGALQADLTARRIDPAEAADQLVAIVADRIAQEAIAVQSGSSAAGEASSSSE